MQAHSFMIVTICTALLSGCVGAGATGDASVERGQTVFANECVQCHGITAEGGGAASLGLGVAAPDLTGLTGRNDGYFPREFVRRFVLGSLEKDDPDAAMPKFGRVGMAHVSPNSGPGTELLDADIAALLDYLETIQR